MKSAFLLLPVLFLWGCTEVASNRQTIESNPLGVEAGAYGYTFSGENCVTGEHTFRTREAYCVGLQGEERNNRCALNLRKEQFKKDCEETGFKWLESARCEFFIVKAGATMPVPLSHQILEKKTICAGRMEAYNFENVPRRAGQTLFNRGYIIEVDLESGDAYDARIEITDKSGNAVEDYTIQSSASEVREAILPKNGLRMRVACYKTNYCPK